MMYCAAIKPPGPPGIFLRVKFGARRARAGARGEREKKKKGTEVKMHP